MYRPAADIRRLTYAIAKLWSSDESERQATKKEIVRFGSRAIDPLLSILEDLVRHRYPRFASGKEGEGNEALQHLVGSYQKKTSVEEAWEAGQQYRERLRTLQINGRLLFDLVQLLGSLRAEKAIPLLIEILETERPLHAWESVYPEMEALSQIGVAAVPTLLEVIENANERAEIADWYPSGSIIESNTAVGDYDKNGELQLDEEREEGLDAELPEQRTEGELSFEAMRIIKRAAKVLGAIGDARALPSLERVLHSDHTGFVKPVVEQAIDKIKND